MEEKQEEEDQPTLSSAARRMAMAMVDSEVASSLEERVGASRAREVVVLCDTSLIHLRKMRHAEGGTHGRIWRWLRQVEA